MSAYRGGYGSREVGGVSEGAEKRKMEETGGSERGERVGKREYVRCGWARAVFRRQGK